MRIGSILENQNIEKRVAITPEVVKKYKSLGFEIYLSENYGLHLGIKDSDYLDLGAKIFKDENDFGEGKGTHWNGNDIKLEFYGTKELINTHLALFKKDRDKLILQAHSPENQTNDDGKIKISPPGKYYALLIGNSKYLNWVSLKSPKSPFQSRLRLAQHCPSNYVQNAR